MSYRGVLWCSIVLVVCLTVALLQCRAYHGRWCLRPKGYGYYTNTLSTSLERPQTQVADYFAVYLRRFEGRIEHTPFEPNTPPIAFVKVVLRERGLRQPEIRFGMLSGVDQAPERPEERFEEIATLIVEPLRAMSLTAERNAR